MFDNYPPGAANDPTAPWNEKEINTQVYQVSVNADLAFQIEVEGDYDDEGYFEVNEEDLKAKISDILKEDENIINYNIVNIE